MHQAGNDSCPSGLMTRSQSCPVISMEVFIEKNIVIPMGVVQELPASPIYGPCAVVILEEDVRKALCDLFGDLVESLLFSGPRGAFYLEIIPVVCVEFQQ